MKTPTLRGIPALLVLALALVLGAGTGAVAGTLVTSKQIKDGTIKSVDVHDGTLQTADFSTDARDDLRGDPGPAGVSGYQVVQGTLEVPGGSLQSTILLCPVGTVVMGSAVNISDPGADEYAQDAMYANGQGIVYWGYNGGVAQRIVTASISCATFG